MTSHRHGLYASIISGYSDKTLEDWISKAKKSLTLVENKDYVVRFNPETKRQEVVIVDLQNTGRLNVGSRWSKGLHEMVEVKHQIKPKDENLTGASLSHPAFFGQYEFIYGLTGTIGTEQERKEV